MGERVNKPSQVGEAFCIRGLFGAPWIAVRTPDDRPLRPMTPARRDLILSATQGPQLEITETKVLDSRISANIRPITYTVQHSKFAKTGDRSSMPKAADVHHRTDDVTIRGRPRENPSAKCGSQAPTSGALGEQVGPGYFDSSVQPLSRQVDQDNDETANIELGFLVAAVSSKEPDTRGSSRISCTNERTKDPGRCSPDREITSSSASCRESLLKLLISAWLFALSHVQMAACIFIF
ncbi:predicted protein [Chaetomium globosum CBS 148.51]|uniref:Uncharacterized protein n=1 Tax=Chaetomium globosum (strain ATCC 6205 / CBS 148.51 / DSM 1962 / NBRC 6347 / NRRL 1970) TaxID=306901 RepID=Q2HA93_CHAGB|nr:uncharacterized protein CHGG_02861 [Chaetomium globosum CBS 148.51]EAQ90926.1 predicted protein [Chaetomium globosum CBS 148.51]